MPSSTIVRPDRVRVRPELLPPQDVAQHDDRGGALHELLRQEESAQGRLGAERVEEPVRDLGDPQPVRAPFEDQVGSAVEEPSGLLDVAPRRGESAQLAFAEIGIADAAVELPRHHDRAIGVRPGQFREHDSVQDAEYRRRSSHADG
jgi:hypothetical protein